MLYCIAVRRSSLTTFVSKPYRHAINIIGVVVPLNTILTNRPINPVSSSGNHIKTSTIYHVWIEYYVWILFTVCVCSIIFQRYTFLNPPSAILHLAIESRWVDVMLAARFRFSTAGHQKVIHFHRSQQVNWSIDAVLEYRPRPQGSSMIKKWCSWSWRHGLGLGLDYINIVVHFYQ